MSRKLPVYSNIGQLDSRDYLENVVRNLSFFLSFLPSFISFLSLTPFFLFKFIFVSDDRFTSLLNFNNKDKD